MSQLDTLPPSSEPQKNTFLTYYGKLLGKVGAAITDQAIFAGSNFIINILLARWMSPNEYGAFVVAFSWFILVHNLYEAVLVEPMTYYASDKYAHKFSKYMGFIFYGHTIIGVILAIVLLLGALASHIFDSGLVVSAMIGVAVATPFMSIRWLVRQPFYVQSVPQKAVWGGIVYCVLVIPSMFLLHQFEWLSPFTALIAMGLSGAIASLILVLGLIKPNWNLIDDELNVSSIVKAHWSYSKWAILFRLLNWFQTNFHFILLPLVASLAASGALRSITNIIYPVLMANTAISGVLLPMFVRTYNRNKQQFIRRVRNVLIFLLLIMVANFIFILIFGDKVISLMYDGKYDEYVDLPILISLGAIPIALLTSVTLATALRAMGWVKLTVQAKIIPTILNVTVGILLIVQFEVLGATIITFMSAGSTAIILYIYYRRQLASNEVSPLIASRKTAEEGEERAITNDD